MEIKGNLKNALYAYWDDDDTNVLCKGLDSVGLSLIPFGKTIKQDEKLRAGEEEIVEEEE